MKTRPSNPSPCPASSLEQETLAAFSAWRLSAPLGLRRMSESLWSAAVRLAVATSVYQAARLLRLDFNQLKKRVLASSEENRAVSPSGGNDLSVGRGPVLQKMSLSHNPSHRSAQHSPGPAISSVSNLGFVEVSALGGIASGPQPLAEIRSPAGYTLRLFSVEASRMIEAFMQS